jgi:hypothetical protein
VLVAQTRENEANDVAKQNWNQIVIQSQNDQEMMDLNAERSKASGV